MSPERRHQLDDLRRRQVLAEAKLTPQERLERAEGLRDFVARVKPQGLSRTDEAPELLVRLRLKRLERLGRDSRK